MGKTCDICGRSVTEENFDKHVCLNEFDANIIRKLYAQGMSPDDINKNGYDKRFVRFALIGHRRSRSEATRLAYKNKPEAFKLSDATKKQISVSMKKAHAEGRASYWKIKESYPEKFFNTFLKRSGFEFNKDYFREFRFSRFRADFFFPHLNLVIEIDGSQHYRYEQLQKIDKQKDQYLKSLNIDVIRISWKVLCHESKKVLDDILKVLQDKKNISNFNDTYLNKVIELNVKQTVKKLLNTLKKVLQKKIKNNRINDILQTNFEKRGVISTLSHKWGITHTQVRRFIKSNADKLELDCSFFDK